MSEAESESGLVWFGCWGSPLYPGFPAVGCGGCLVSSGAAEMCQSTQRGDLRSYGNKTKSQWAAASYRRHTIKTREPLRLSGVSHQKKDPQRPCKVAQIGLSLAGILLLIKLYFNMCKRQKTQKQLKLELNLILIWYHLYLAKKEETPHW